MSPLLLLTLTFLVTLLWGMPVAVVLGVASAVYLLAADMPLTVIPQKMFSGMDSFVLLSIPAFVLAGNLMNGGGITDRILRFSNSVVGHFRGGLAQTNIVGSMIFAGISGSAAADAASQGAVLIPGMARQGYTVPYSAAVTAASAVVGPIIPPSIPMIIVGSLTGISVGQMFLAGAVPGLLLGLGMMVPAYVLAVRDNHPREPWRGWGEVWASGKDALWAMGMMFLILFGIVGGYFTPTEAAVIAVLYAIVVGLFVYKELGWRDIPRLVADSAISGAAIMLLVGFASVFGWILAAERIPQMLTEWMTSISTERWALMIMMNVLLIVVGMFMETIAALIILFGIVGGYFTPTEAAVIAVLYAIVVGLFVYKELGWRDIPRLAADSAISGAAIMLLVGFANVFGWILAAERIPQMLTEWMTSISTERWALMIMMNLLLIVVGMFMETIAALIILFPPLLAVATAAGMDPIHFATFAVLNLMIGLATPPVGVCLFICASIGRISLWEITVAVWPFLLSNFVVLALVTAIPQISLWLPSLFYR